MKIGKAKYDIKKTVFKIEDGDNVFRILPPLGKLADSGKWNQYYRIEWGYKNSSGRHIPFQDIRKINFNTKMVEVESPAYLKREKLKENLKQVVEKFKNGQATKEQVQDAKNLVKRYNLDAKYYMNAVNLKGQIGLLKLNSTLFKMLRQAIDTSRKSGIEPLGIKNGLYFNFTRHNETGKIQDYVFSVSPYMETQADGSLRRVTHTMDDAFISRLSDEAYELSGMYPKFTLEQVTALVNAGENHGAVMDKILEENKIKTSSSVNNTVSNTVQSVQKSNDVTINSTQTNPTVTPTSSIKINNNGEIEIKETASQPSTVEDSVSTTESKHSITSDMSDEEFLNMIGEGI